MRLLKGAVVVVLGLSVLFLTFVVPFHQFLPPYMHWEDTYVIRPGGRFSLGINLMSGGIVQIMLFANGAGSINFHAEDSEGKIVIDERRVSGRYLLEFQPAKTDSLILVFENRDSSQLEMGWSIGVFHYDTTFQLSGLILCGIGVSMTVLDRIRKRTAADQAVTAKREDKPRVTHPTAGLAAVEGVSLEWLEKMKAAGVGSADELAECNPVELAGKIGVSEKTASAWIQNAKKTLALIRELETAKK